MCRIAGACLWYDESLLAFRGEIIAGCGWFVMLNFDRFEGRRVWWFLRDLAGYRGFSDSS